MKIEIAICTWNRQRLLRGTLSRLQQISNSVPAGHELRMIVVDNGSNDETGGVINEFAHRLPLVFLCETRLGQAYARNRAVAAAEGDLLLWIDDDVLVREEWLSSYLRAAECGNEVSFWGGPIRPKFERPMPQWIRQNWTKLSGCFAERELGQQPIEFRTEVLPYGANFAIRTSVQKEYLFEVGMGRVGNAVSGDDDCDLLRRLIENGHRGCWVPDAAVEHVIDPTRATTDYVGRYFVGQGGALIRRGAGWSDSVEELAKQASHELFWYRVKRFGWPSEVWLSHLIRGSLALGQKLQIITQELAVENQPRNPVV
jgi:glycosyltransferase involved in cell wall biosynthesis